MGIELLIELTHRCNLKCDYCYNKYSHSRKELSPRDWLRILKHIEGVSSITFAGGEPLLYKNIFELAKQISSKHKILLGIATNAHLLTAEIVKKLLNAGITYFEISLDSLNPENYTSMCGSSLPLINIKEAIHLINQSRAKVFLSTLVSKRNLGEIDKIIDFANLFSTRGVILNQFNPPDPSSNRDLSIGTEELHGLLESCNKRAKKSGLALVFPTPIPKNYINTEPFNNLFFGSCKCGINKWVITPDGSLKTCEQNMDVLGNLLKINFKDLKKCQKPWTFGH